MDGVPNTITCAGGLIFDPTKGQCDYSDQTKRYLFRIIVVWISQSTQQCIYIHQYYCAADPVVLLMNFSSSNVQKLALHMNTPDIQILMVWILHITIKMCLLLQFRRIIFLEGYKPLNMYKPSRLFGFWICILFS